MKVKDLQANPENPRTITDAKLQQLKDALYEFGDLSGITNNIRFGSSIIGGTQRTKNIDPNAPVKITTRYDPPTRTGTVAEGYIISDGERFTYREVDWDKRREKRASIAANKNAGQWDIPQLKEWITDIRTDVNVPLSLTMFDMAELTDLGLIQIQTESVGVTGVHEDDLPVKAPARTRMGQVYELGDHRLICGDSTRLQTFIALMAGEKAKMVWTDPPYNVAYTGKTKEALTIDNDEMSDKEFLQFLTDAFTCMADVTEKGGAVYVAHASRESVNFYTSIKDAGFEVKQCLIWVKQTLVMGRQDYQWRHEPILYGWKEGASHNWYSNRKQTTVLEFAKPARNAEHPTMKPVELIEYCLGNNSKVGDVVLDGFGGSGSTLIACEKLKRKARLVELDPVYCDVIIKRWEDYTGRKAKLVGPERSITRKSQPRRELVGNI